MRFLGLIVLGFNPNRFQSIEEGPAVIFGEKTFFRNFSHFDDLKTHCFAQKSANFKLSDMSEAKKKKFPDPQTQKKRRIGLKTV